MRYRNLLEVWLLCVAAMTGLACGGTRGAPPTAPASSAAPAEAWSDLELESVEDLIDAHRFDQANARLAELKKARRERFGESHPRTLWIEVLLASSAKGRGEYERARALLSAAEQRLGSQVAPDLRGRIEIERAEVALAITEFAPAVRHADAAVAALREGTPMHLTRAYRIKALAEIAQSRFSEAERALNLAQHAAEKGERSQIVLSYVESDRAVHALQRGDLERAEQLGQQALKTAKRLLGADHVEVAHAETLLAMIARQHFDYAAALEHTRRALAVLERLGRADSSLAVAALVNRGAALAGMGRLAEALPVLSRAGKLAQRDTSLCTPLGIAAVKLTAEALVEAGASERAAQLLDGLLVELRKTVGDSHRDVALLAASLAELTNVLSDKHQAAMWRLARQAMATRKDLSASSHLVAKAIAARQVIAASDSAAAATGFRELAEAWAGIKHKSSGLPPVLRARAITATARTDPDGARKKLQALLDSKHPALLDFRPGLVESLANAGEVETARAYGYESLAMFEARYVDHKLISMLVAMYLVEVRAGDTERSEAFARRIQKIATKMKPALYGKPEWLADALTVPLGKDKTEKLMLVSGDPSDFEAAKGVLGAAYPRFAACHAHGSPKAPRGARLVLAVKPSGEVLGSDLEFGGDLRDGFAACVSAVAQGLRFNRNDKTGLRRIHHHLWFDAVDSASSARAH